MSTALLPSAPPRKRNEQLRPGDIALLLKLHQDGLTQVQIAQRLECDQKTVSNWLSRLHDTTALADSYLRGKAFDMAKNVAHKGKADVQLKALQGLGVAAQGEQARGVTVIVGGSASVQVNVLSPQLSHDSHILTVEQKSI